MSSVFSPSTSITISAPGEKVFALLTDFSTWPSWNSFIPAARVLASDQSSNDVNSETHLKVGHRMHFDVCMPFFGQLRKVPGGSIEKVTVVETPTSPTNAEQGTWRVSWDQDGLPLFLLRTVRVNEVTELRTEDGTVQCTYRTYMTFDGPFAWFVKYTTGGKVQSGLELWAEDLKRAAEA
ncbi:hypothetical protein K490DRAFT_38798 [Saccharata proteae CBS 121410]|uniref:Bet v1-like protein n=1 Tax=Saccharata proteae CBS 121410 TaxID=1314787 RepID=A0A6A5YCZ8_9PEZI|nr:hypothetical protein K490DRAFT_38798 [Saccharata proteae CBS 121410]